MTPTPTPSPTPTPTPTPVPVPPSPVDARNAKYATAGEDGANRFRRLHSLGYV